MPRRRWQRKHGNGKEHGSEAPEQPRGAADVACGPDCSGTNGKGKMPAYKGKLSDDEISAVAKYVKTLK